jgi:uncharacterized membrane protein
VSARAGRIALAAALLALAGVFAVWFRDDAQPLAAWALFALPPLLLGICVLRASRAASFWSGVLALFWFCHGVMLAYDRPAERGYAVAEIVLALAIVVLSSLPGLRARFGRGRASD